MNPTDAAMSHTHVRERERENVTHKHLRERERCGDGGNIGGGFRV
jgi:hypothetical protein